MKLIDINDLEYWSGKPESNQDLPLLISRLIRSTTPSISGLIIPKGKSIFRGGWDGIVTTSNSSEFVPNGVSLWEFGSEANPAQKANSDFTKRTKNPLGQTPSTSTFVFVTTRTWEKRQTWIDEQVKKKIWKDVRVIDGNILVEWLLTSPIQSQELANNIGKTLSPSLESPEQLWENWSNGPNNMKLPPALITAGREKDKLEVFNALETQKEIVFLQAPTKEEALIFFIACVLESENNIKEEFLAKTVIVEDHDDFKTLVLSKSPLIIIPKYINLGAFRSAIAKGHYILLPLGADENHSLGYKINLGRIDREKIVHALIQLGLNEEKARSISKETGRNITIIRRRLGFDGTKPEWAAKEYYKDLLPALLVGRWDETKNGDRYIVEYLADEPYDQYIGKLNKWLSIPDAPIYRIGSKWRLASPLDSFTHLSQYISKPLLGRLSECFSVACSEIKPALSLEADQRYMASFLGKTPDFSKYIREGLSQSLILIALYGEGYQLPVSSSPQNWVDQIIFNLCHKQSPDLWKSLDDILPLLAEASPTAFLKSIEDFITQNPKELAGIFEETSSSFFSSYYHTGLLWALEALAWIPEHLLRVSLVLLELDQLDPKVKIQNRPINSITSLFLSWIPQTAASLAQRKQVIETIKIRKSEMAWRLFEVLLPSYSNGHADINPKLRWRYSEHEITGIAPDTEMYEFNSFLIKCAISICNFQPDRIARLLNSIEQILPSDRAIILTYIKDNLSNIIDDDQLISNKLRNILYNENSRDQSYASLYKSEIETINVLYTTLSSKSITDKYLWIFNTAWPEFPDGIEGSMPYDKQGEYVQSKRRKALKEIYKDISFKDFLMLIRKIEEPGIFGSTLAQIRIKTSEALEFYTLLESPLDKEISAATAFFKRIYFDKGFEYCKRQYKKLSKNMSDKGLLNFLLAMPPEHQVWDFVETLPLELHNIYWRNCAINFWNKDNDQQEYQIAKLTQFSRFYSCLDIVYYNKEQHNTENIIKVLRNIALQPTEDFVRLNHSHAQFVFDELYKRTDCNEQDLGALEWQYIFLLKSSRRTIKHLILHKEISRNPTFFVDVLSYIYPSDDPTRNETENKGLENEQIIHRAKSAYELLGGWKLIPGSKVDENNKINLDSQYLNDWVNEVRILAEKIGRLKKADLFIGKILAQYPEENEQWPPDAIAEIIDTIATEEICINFRIEISNKRSMSSRGPFEGGQRERNLSIYFTKLAANHNTKHPITASILNGLATKYSASAKQEDDEARENDLDN